MSGFGNNNNAPFGGGGFGQAPGGFGQQQALGGFGQQQPQQQQAPGFGQAATSGFAPPASSFGSVAPTPGFGVAGFGNAAATPGFGNATTAAPTPGFGGGGGAAAPTPGFGNATAAAPTPGFGGGAAAAPTPGFGNATAAAPTPGFGGGAAAATTPGFGNAAAAAPTTGFGNVPAASVGFGGAVATATPSFPTNTVATASSFGNTTGFGGGTTNTNNNASTFGSASSNMFVQPSFPSSSTSATTGFGNNSGGFGTAPPGTSFGNNPPTAAANPFGGTNTTNNNSSTAAPLSFGASSNVMMGGDDSNMNDDNNNNTGFGASNNNTATGFGAPSSETMNTGFGGTNNSGFGGTVGFSPSFGNNNAAAPSSSLSTTAPSFAPSATPLFGSTTTTTKEEDMGGGTTTPHRGQSPNPGGDQSMSPKPSKGDEKLQKLKAKLAAKKAKLEQAKKEKKTDKDTDLTTTKNKNAATADTPAGLAERNAIRFGTKMKKSPSKTPTSKGKMASSSSSSPVPPFAATSDASQQPPAVVARSDAVVLEDATDLIGTCPDMCPSEERTRREAEQDIQLLETLHSSLHPPNLTLASTMVKRFRRSAADYKLNVPEWVRPPPVLEQTCAYLEEYIMDKDRQGPDARYMAAPQATTDRPTPLDCYLFCWDRTRMIRKDFILQNYVGGKEGKCDAAAIRCHERIARWHILCEHQLSHLEDFVTMQSQQNIAELGQALKTLNLYYDTPSWDNNSGKTTSSSSALTKIHGCHHTTFQGETPKDYQSGEVLQNDESSLGLRRLGNPNASQDGTSEAEMRGLYILLTIDNDGGMEVLKYAAHLSRTKPTIYNSPEVQLALTIFQTKQELLYAPFFRILRDEKTPYLFACLMFKHVEEMRRIAIRIMSSTYGYKAKTAEGKVVIRHDSYPLKDLMQLLCCEDLAETKALCEFYNITVSDDSETISWKTSRFRIPRDPEKGFPLKFPPQQMIRTIEAKARSKTRLAICRGEVSHIGGSSNSTFVTPSSAVSTKNVITTTATMNNQQHFVKNTTDLQQSPQVQQQQEDKEQQLKPQLLVRQQQEEEEKKRKLMKKKQEQEQIEAKKQLLEKKKEALRRKKEEEERQRVEAAKKQKQEQEKERQKRLLILQQQKEIEQQREKERVEKERIVEQERLEKERLLRLEQERLEQERLEKERLEQERRRLEKEHLEKERLERERLEKERLEKERLEQERLERERLERERLERERRRREEEEKQRILKIKKVLLWKRLRSKLNKKIQQKRSQQSLQMIGSCYVPMSTIHDHVVMNLKNESSSSRSDRHQETEIITPTTTSSIDEQQELELPDFLESLIHQQDVCFSLKNLLDKVESQISAKIVSSKSSTNGKIAKRTKTVLIKVAIHIPIFQGGQSELVHELMHQWIHSRLRYNQVHSTAHQHIRLVVANGDRDQSSPSSADVALLIIPPVVKGSQGTQDTLQHILSNDSSSQIVWNMDDRSDPAYTEYIESQIMPMINPHQEVASTSNDGDDDFDQGLSYVLKGSMMLALKTTPRIDILSILQLIFTAMDQVLLHHSKIDQIMNNDPEQILQQARQALSKIQDQILPNLQQDLILHYSSWPAQEFLEIASSLRSVETPKQMVPNYFAPKQHLPAHWAQSLVSPQVSKTIETLSSVLNSRTLAASSYHDVVASLLLSNNNESDDAHLFGQSLLRHRQYAQCLAFSIQHYCEHASSDDDAFVYLPEGISLAMSNDDKDGVVEVNDGASGNFITNRTTTMPSFSPEENRILEVDQDKGTLTTIEKNELFATSKSDTTPRSLSSHDNNNHDITPSAAIHTPPSYIHRKRQHHHSNNEKVGDTIGHKRRRRTAEELKSMAFTRKLQAMLEGDFVQDMKIGTTGSKLSDLLRHAPPPTIPPLVMDHYGNEEEELI